MRLQIRFPRREELSIMCLQWMKWADPFRQYLGALIVAQVDEERNIYRRIGWLQVVDAAFFDE